MEDNIYNKNLMKELKALRNQIGNPSKIEKEASDLEERNLNLEGLRIAEILESRKLVIKE